MKKILSKFYLLGLLIVVAFLTVLIWNLTFQHLIDGFRSHTATREVAEESKELSPQEEGRRKFQETVLDTGEKVKHYLGYRVLEEQRLEGHFHRIDFEVSPDRRNYCNDCHGEIPHDKVPHLRAFFNMHSTFIACQTCHVRLEGDQKTGIFKWYDRTSGEIVPSPVSEDVLPGTYPAKIIPFEKVNGQVRRIDSQEKIQFAQEYEEREKSLTELQKVKAKKIIHEQVDKKPYTCEDCHQKEAPLLPLKDLGFPQHRIDAIRSTEVIGMIKKYTEFYIPRILEPGFGQQPAQEEQP
jgi:hypothetical protein